MAATGRNIVAQRKVVDVIGDSNTMVADVKHNGF